MYQCRARESNPDEGYPPAVFKTAASAISPARPIDSMADKPDEPLHEMARSSIACYSPKKANTVELIVTPALTGAATRAHQLLAAPSGARVHER
jgi:hypothetical protein